MSNFAPHANDPDQTGFEDSRANGATNTNNQDFRGDDISVNVNDYFVPGYMESKTIKSSSEQSSSNNMFSQVLSSDRLTILSFTSTKIIVWKRKLCTSGA